MHIKLCLAIVAFALAVPAFAHADTFTQANLSGSVTGSFLVDDQSGLVVPGTYFFSGVPMPLTFDQQSAFPASGALPAVLEIDFTWNPAGRVLEELDLLFPTSEENPLSTPGGQLCTEASGNCAGYFSAYQYGGVADHVDPLAIATIAPSDVAPEPSSLLLLGTGAVSLLSGPLFRRRTFRAGTE